MRGSMPSRDWKVAKLIEPGPAAPVVFHRSRMACVGCATAPFETLVEATPAYHVEPDEVLGRFQRSLHDGSGKEAKPPLLEPWTRVPER